MQTRSKKSGPRSPKRIVAKADDFVSVARHLGADEDKARFEAKLGRIAKAVTPKQDK